MRLDALLNKVRDHPIKPMTGNIGELGARSLDVSYRKCHHQALLRADHRPDDTVLMFGLRIACQGCGIVDADVRPKPEGHGLSGETGCNGDAER